MKTHEHYNPGFYDLLIQNSIAHDSVCNYFQFKLTSFVLLYPFHSHKYYEFLFNFGYEEDTEMESEFFFDMMYNYPTPNFFKFLEYTIVVVTNERYFRFIKSIILKVVGRPAVDVPNPSPET